MLELEWTLGEFVYLKTDHEQHPRIVTGVRLTVGMGPMYVLSCGERETSHFSCEISSTRNLQAVE